MTASIRRDTESLDSLQRAELLERISSSLELRRAARLREFLRYVGRRSLETPHVPISEQDIGIHVFGRAQDYDTSVDNIVRVNASELRKRIAAYFASEGLHETLLLEIPRGSYTPQFRPRPVEDNSVESKVESKPALNSEPSRELDASRSPRPAIQSVAFPAVCILVVALAAICLSLFRQNRSIYQELYRWKSEPALGPFWSGMLDSPRQTDIIVADTSFALIEDILHKQISLNDYLNRSYIQQIQTSGLRPELKSDLQIIATRSNGSLGDFRVAQKILAFDPVSIRTHLQYARDYRPSAFKTNNVILIGSSRSNPWSSLFEDRLNFTLDYDPFRNETLVKNRHPQSGESDVYIAPVDPNNSSGYSVIDFIPNQDNSADVLIIAGTTSEATEAAGDFLTSEETLSRFQNRLHVRTFPYFEVLLKTVKLIGTPLSAEVIAYRTLGDRHRSTP